MPLPAPHFASRRHNWARFGGTARNAYLCLSRKRKSAGFSSFRVFGLTILYERKKLSYMSVKIISNPVKICSFIIFRRCFKVNITLIFAEIISEQISIVLIIPKLSRRAALTIANAPFTIRAERKTRLTSFTRWQKYLHLMREQHPAAHDKAHKPSYFSLYYAL